VTTQLDTPTAAGAAAGAAAAVSSHESFRFTSLLQKVTLRSFCSHQYRLGRKTELFFTALH